jgi:hypothetical protein
MTPCHNISGTWEACSFKEQLGLFGRLQGWSEFDEITGEGSFLIGWVVPPPKTHYEGVVSQWKQGCRAYREYFTNFFQCPVTVHFFVFLPVFLFRPVCRCLTIFSKQTKMEENTSSYAPFTDPFPFTEKYGTTQVFEPGVVFIKGALNPEQQQWLARYSLTVTGVLTEEEDKPVMNLDKETKFWTIVDGKRKFNSAYTRGRIYDAMRSLPQTETLCQVSPQINSRFVPGDFPQK